MGKRPNFFVIGASKCGTTAMCDYLRTHPNVFISNPKEPGYFAPDVALLQYQSMDEYLDLFASAQPQHTVITDASTCYIRSHEALGRIAKFQPDARILVMLRKPTDLVYSFHAEQLRGGWENVWDFEKAWELGPERAEGRAVPVGVIALDVAYQWVGSLGSQVERVLQTFPRENVHFIVFDDFAKNPRSEYLKLLQFLGLPDDGRVEFPKINEGVQFKSRVIARIPRYLRASTRRYLPSVKRLLGIRRRLFIIEKLDRLITEPRPRPPLRPEFRQHLDDVFRDEVVLLEKLIGKDLSSWRNLPAAAGASAQTGSAR